MESVAGSRTFAVTLKCHYYDAIDLDWDTRKEVLLLEVDSPYPIALPQFDTGPLASGLHLIATTRADIIGSIVVTCRADKGYTPLPIHLKLTLMPKQVLVNNYVLSLLRRSVSVVDDGCHIQDTRPVPEPGILWLILPMLFLLAALTRRCR